MAAPKITYHTSLAAFVDPRVKTIAVTDEILAAVMPFFPTSCTVISGYLNEEDLYWKVNYHWDCLLEAIEHALTLSIPQTNKDALAAVQKSLWTNPPDPARGYRKSGIGKPKDLSTHAEILKRHGILRQAKKDFKQIYDAADLLTNSKRTKKTWGLAYAPVAAPGVGKHATGYCLDISGNETTVRRIALSLGATLALKEVSHVHCEWPNGVDTTQSGGADSVAGAQRGASINASNKVSNVRHCLLRTA